MSKPELEVAAGVIMRPDGQVLLAQRPDDKAWPGWWELPGGKIEAGETPRQALIRELQEELDIRVHTLTPWVRYTYDYPSTRVHLMLHRVTGWHGEPRGAEGQIITWTHPQHSHAIGELLPATQAPMRWAHLPDRYLITHIKEAAGLANFLARLDRALALGVRLIQFREPSWAEQASAGNAQAHDALYAAFQAVLARCRQHHAACLVNSVHPQEWWAQADGVHLRARDAALWAEKKEDDPLQALLPRAPGAPQPHFAASRGTYFVGVSAHNKVDLAHARRLAADFAVIGHVLDTPSHAQETPLGWPGFAQLNACAGLPVFAIGGQSAASLAPALAHGAHGVAIMRGCLTKA